MADIPVTTPVEAAWPRGSRGAAGSAPLRPSARRVRVRSAVRCAVGMGVALLLFLWKPLLAAVVAAVSLLLLLVGLLSPLGVYAAVERGLERFAHAVGVAVTWILLTPLYLVLFVPLGLVLRRRSLRLTLGPDSGLSTYWSEPEGGAGERWQGEGADRYRRQF